MLTCCGIVFCSVHGCCAVECDVACCAMCYTATATLILPRTRLVAHQSIHNNNNQTHQLIPSPLGTWLYTRAYPRYNRQVLLGGLASCQGIPSACVSHTGYKWMLNTTGQILHTRGPIHQHRLLRSASE